jgi:hypothetical protein
MGSPVGVHCAASPDSRTAGPEFDNLRQLQERAVSAEPPLGPLPSPGYSKQHGDECGAGCRVAVSSLAAQQRQNVSPAAGNAAFVSPYGQSESLLLP